MESGNGAKTVAVLGASPKSDRYAFRAMQLLQKHGYGAIPVNPAFDEVLGEKCYPSMTDVPGPVDTVTMYVGKERSDSMIGQIVGSKPRRIIMNPGSENDDLANKARENGIEVLEACTLVMLGRGTF